MQLLTKIKTGIKGLKYSKVGILARDKAPEIFLGIGLVTFGSTIYLACKATTKLEDVIDEHQEELDRLNRLVDDINNSLDTAQDKDEENYCLDELVEVKHDKRVLYRHTAWRVTKLYGPSAVTAIISITSLVGGNRILRNRYNNAVIAGNAILSAFNLYREKVREELGEAADIRFRYGGTTEPITVKDENGNDVEVLKNKFEAPNFSFDAIVFSPETSSAYDRNMEFNLSLIEGQISYLNMTYKGRKERHAVLNELLDMLSIEQTSFGMTNGWHQDAHENEQGFTIKSGIDPEYKYQLLENWRLYERTNGREGSITQPILIRLNIDGDIVPYLRNNEEKEARRKQKNR